MRTALPRARPSGRRAPPAPQLTVATAVAVLIAVATGPLERRSAPLAVRAQGVASSIPPPTAAPGGFQVEIRPTPHGEAFGPALPGPSARPAPARAPTTATPGLQAARLAVVAVVVVVALRALRLRDADRR